jgi:hypothetical protein
VGNIIVQGNGFVVPDSEIILLPLDDKETLVDAFYLPACVCDIITGKLSIKQLGKVISFTNAPNREIFRNESIAEYLRVDWKLYQSRARIIVLQLYDENRIIQPRLEGKKPAIGGPGLYTRSGWYEENLDEINRVI